MPVCACQAYSLCSLEASMSSAMSYVFWFCTCLDADFQDASQQHARTMAETMKEALTLLLEKASVSEHYSSVGSRQASMVLRSLDIRECDGNLLFPIVVAASTPQCPPFDHSKCANGNEGTPELLQYHQEQLIKFGLVFDRGGFQMFNLASHNNLYPIEHDSQEYQGGVDGGVAPFGLLTGSASRALRVAYLHKQPKDQQQQCQEAHSISRQVCT